METKEEETVTPEQLVEQLRALKVHIPDFAPLTQQESANLRRTAGVHDELIQAAANAAGASPVVTNVIGTDAGTILNERVEVARWSAVEAELRTMYKGIAASNLARRHRLGQSTMQAYLISRELVKQREHADLLPHVQEMKRVRRLGRRRNTTTGEAAAVPASA